jgi:hypothetical protein
MTVAVRDLDVSDEVKTVLIERCNLVPLSKRSPPALRAVNRQLAAALPPDLRDLWLERALALSTSPDFRSTVRQIRARHAIQGPSSVSMSRPVVWSVVYNLADDIRLRGSALAHLNELHIAEDRKDLHSVLGAENTAYHGRFARWSPHWRK